MENTTKQTLVYVYADGYEHKEDVSKADIEKIKDMAKAEAFFSHSIKSIHILIENDTETEKILI